VATAALSLALRFLYGEFLDDVAVMKGT
jgi:hypothetical protein